MGRRIESMANQRKKQTGPGRPLKFTHKKMKEKIDAYFKDCKENKRPLTITGLALALDTSRGTLKDYEYNRGDEFSDTIKRAKLMCQNFAEEYLFTGKHVAGAIFNLVNNYGWENKMHQKVKVASDLSNKTDAELDEMIREAQEALNEE